MCCFSCCWCCEKDSTPVYKLDDNDIEMQRKRRAEGADKKQSSKLSIAVEPAAKSESASSPALSMSSASALSVTRALSSASASASPYISPLGSANGDRTRELMEQFGRMTLTRSATTTPPLRTGAENEIHRASDECGIVLDDDQVWYFPFPVAEIIAQYVAVEDAAQNIFFQSVLTSEKIQYDTFLGIVRVSTNALAVTIVKDPVARRSLLKNIQKYFSHIKEFYADTSQLSEKEFSLLPSLSRLESLTLYPSNNITSKAVQRALFEYRNQAEENRFPHLVTLTLGISAAKHEEDDLQFESIHDISDKVFRHYPALESISFDGEKISQAQQPVVTVNSFKRRPSFFVMSSYDSTDSFQPIKNGKKSHRRVHTLNTPSALGSLLDTDNCDINEDENS